MLNQEQSASESESLSFIQGNQRREFGKKYLLICSVEGYSKVSVDSMQSAIVMLINGNNEGLFPQVRKMAPFEGSIEDNVEGKEEEFEAKRVLKNRHNQGLHWHQVCQCGTRHVEGQGGDW